MSIVIYPGSFDPVTNGHVNLIERAARLFDTVVVAVAFNAKKAGLFSVPERLQMLQDSTAHIEHVRIDAFDGLLVDYMRTHEIQIVLRGLRAVSDFEYEFQMAHMNRKLWSGIETFFMVTGADEFYISSQVVKEVAALGGSVKELVPEPVCRQLEAKLGPFRTP